MEGKKQDQSHSYDAEVECDRSESPKSPDSDSAGTVSSNESTRVNVPTSPAEGRHDPASSDGLDLIHLNGEPEYCEWFRSSGAGYEQWTSSLPHRPHKVEGASSGGSNKRPCMGKGFSPEKRAKCSTERAVPNNDETEDNDDDINNNNNNDNDNDNNDNNNNENNTTNKDDKRHE